MAQTPYGMTWSTDTYGPDGPWNAISVEIGTQWQSIALYPGGNWESTILLPTLCTNTSISSKCYAGDAGIYNADDSLTWDITTIQQPPDGNWQKYTMGFADDVPVYASAQRAMDTITLWNGVTVPHVSLIGISEGYQTYPGGQNYPLEVGVLSLGANEPNQTFSVNDTHAVEANFVTGWLYESRRIPSYSYGMHIGSAAQKIPGSLVLGGYEIARALGNVSSQPYNGTKFPIQLLDIGIGVVTGDSPWNSSNITNLLAPGNTTLQRQRQQQQQERGTKVLVTGADPYLYLPQSTCEKITSHLPVTYNSSLGLYFWNTKDIQYHKIVKSPSYLSFTFAANASRDTNSNITIKVPFALLNLKLEAPLVAESTPYFPCMGTANGPTDVLGRAFLQAAFVGVNWTPKRGDGNWFLAQAPGPGYSRSLSESNVIRIHETNETIIGSIAPSWEETWMDHWTPLNNTDNSTFTESESSGSGGGISSDLITIIGATVGGVVGLVVLACILCKRTRRPQRGGYSPPGGEQDEYGQRRQQEEHSQRGEQLPPYSAQAVDNRADNGKPASRIVAEPQSAAQSQQTPRTHTQQPGTHTAERRETSKTSVVRRNDRGTAHSSREEHIVEYHWRSARVVSSSSSSSSSS
ncbi:hypothetical protein EYB26_001768 [Talaromyces marneffei]|uniref:uncharacterized protein n=1 Tax=Talaromyces marneffei TaxID=37727 RepID=UPI0012A8E6A5|nr:uncharacterized protein EYB26_001768 [Talaromyces marneffei]QGA14115.1 hypothetical protein EYB26_001768 [Talaromyces marneffei]